MWPPTLLNSRQPSRRRGPMLKGCQSSPVPFPGTSSLVSRPEAVQDGIYHTSVSTPCD